MPKLFWNAESPYCRIILWHISANGLRNKVELQHLSWDEIRSALPGGLLGPTATVPCLHLDDGRMITDSLRILAHLLDDGFYSWFLSEDGELYRHIEGQLSRVMYGLYDQPSPETFKKLDERWKLALSAAQFNLSTNAGAHHFKSDSLHLSIKALHVFVQFCLMFKPQWHDSVPSETASALLSIEQTEAFEWLEEQLLESSTKVAVRFSIARNQPT